MTGNSVPLTQHKAFCLCHQTDDLLFAYKTPIPSYNRRLNAECHSSMPFPMSYVFFLLSLYFYRIVFCSLKCFLSFCSILSHYVHTIFFLLFPHSNIHHSSFLTSPISINYFISILPAFAFVQ